MVVWYAEGSPFESPSLCSPAFLAVLSPMVKRLQLRDLDVHITPHQFAAICELSALEELSIEGSDRNEKACYPSFPLSVSLPMLLRCRIQSLVLLRSGRVAEGGAGIAIPRALYCVFTRFPGMYVPLYIGTGLPCRGL
jgi:hypothetical protein